MEDGERASGGAGRRCGRMDEGGEGKKKRKEKEREKGEKEKKEKI
jgi:hypothetical protein